MTWPCTRPKTAGEIRSSCTAVPRTTRSRRPPCRRRPSRSPRRSPRLLRRSSSTCRRRASVPWGTRACRRSRETRRARSRVADRDTANSQVIAEPITLPAGSVRVGASDTWPEGFSSDPNSFPHGFRDQLWVEVAQMLGLRAADYISFWPVMRIKTWTGGAGLILVGALRVRTACCEEKAADIAGDAGAGAGGESGARAGGSDGGAAGAAGSNGDPGALIHVTATSQVGVLLDEVPESIRERVAKALLSKPDSFYEARARRQLTLSTYRLNFRSA